ncbi:MAG: nucleotide-binding protein [Candidatus Hydrogenedentota bacterium]
MADSHRLVIVTGLSGSGKSQALKFLEDLGYFCVDNLPVMLLPRFAELIARSESATAQVAVCVDARGGEPLLNLPAIVDETTELGIRPEILFLDSSNEVLVQRYSESRRRHPVSPTGSVEEGILEERRLLEPIRARADLVLDTSRTSVAQLRDQVASVFHGGRKSQELVISVMSFGFKHGVPPEADLMLDVRFLPNPHYVTALRPWTGNEPEVRAFVLENPDAIEFLDRVKGLLQFLIPRYEAEPKSYLTIAVGCTGGQHRSVAVANELAGFLKDTGRTVRLRHRDIQKGDRTH